MASSKEARRRENREAGLCACGNPPRPNRKTCQRCGDQVKRANAKRKKKEKPMADNQEIIRNKLRANISQLATALERLKAIDVDAVPAGGLGEANRMADSALHALRLLTNAATAKSEVAPPAPPPPTAPVPDPPENLIDVLDEAVADIVGAADGVELSRETVKALKDAAAFLAKALACIQQDAKAQEAAA